MWAASCLASCCAACACDACRTVVSGISRRSARIAYCGLFALSLIVSWILREVAAPLMEKIPCKCSFSIIKLWKFNFLFGIAFPLCTDVPFYKFMSVGWGFTSYMKAEGSILNRRRIQYVKLSFSCLDVVPVLL